MAVPAMLQGSVGSTELRYSLETCSLGYAKLKARLIAGRIQQQLFMDLGGYPGMGSLGCSIKGDFLNVEPSPESIQEMIKSYLLAN